MYVAVGHHWCEELWVFQEISQLLKDGEIRRVSLLEGKWWVGECLYGDILYDDVFSGCLNVFV